MQAPFFGGALYFLTFTLSVCGNPAFSLPLYDFFYSRLFVLISHELWLLGSFKGTQ